MIKNAKLCLLYNMCSTCRLKIAKSPFFFNKNHKILLKQKVMEIYTIFMDWKSQCCEDINSPKIVPHILYAVTIKIPGVIFRKIK